MYRRSSLYIFPYHVCSLWIFSLIVWVVLYFTDKFVAYIFNFSELLFIYLLPVLSVLHLRFSLRPGHKKLTAVFSPKKLMVNFCEWHKEGSLVVFACLWLRSGLCTAVPHLWYSSSRIFSPVAPGSALTQDVVLAHESWDGSCRISSLQVLELMKEKILY